jgi:hypothetical protein
MTQKVWAHGLQTHLAANACNQKAEYYSSHSFVSTEAIRPWDLLLTKDGTVSDHHAVHYQSSLLLELLCRTTSDPLTLLGHLS